MNFSRVLTLKKEGEIHKALQTIEEIQEHYDLNHPDYLNLQLLKAEIWIITSRYAEAKRLLNNLIDIARRQKDLLSKLDVIILLAELYWQIGQLDNTILMIEMGEIDFTKLSPNFSAKEKSLRYAKLKRLKGIYYQYTGEIDLALEYFNESLVEAERLDDDQFIADIYNRNGLIYQKTGDLTKAWNYYIQAYKIRQETLDRLGEGFSLYNLGKIQEYIGELEHALKNYRDAFNLSKEMENRRLKALCLSGIASVYHKQGRFEDAMSNFSRGLAICEDLENDIETSWTLFRILDLLLNTEKAELAPIYMDGLEKLLETNNQNELIIQHNKLIKAQILKNGETTIDKANAQTLLYDILDGNVVDQEITIRAMLNLTNLLIEEFKLTGNREILTELDYLFNKLLDFVEKQHSYPLLSELLLLQGKFAFLEQEFEKAFTLFERAKKIAETKGLILLSVWIVKEIKITKMFIEEFELYDDNEAAMLNAMERTDREDEIADLIREHTKSQLLNQEQPVLFMILHNENKRIYNYIHLDDIVDDGLVESFLEVINKIMKETFRSPSPVERIIHGDFFILIKSVDQLQFVYIFKGKHSLNSFERFDEIIVDILSDQRVSDQIREGNVDHIIDKIDEIVNTHLLMP